MGIYSSRTKGAGSSTLLSKPDCNDMGELVPTEGRGPVKTDSGMFPAQAVIHVPQYTQVEPPSHTL